MGPVGETGGTIGFDIMHPDHLPEVMVSFAELLEGKATRDDVGVPRQAQGWHVSLVLHYCHQLSGQSGSEGL